MSILFALLAGLANAVNVVTQHIASTVDSGRLSGWRLVVSLFRNVLWLAGWVALIGAFVFQALALHWGQLSVVQPLLVSELLFALLLRRFWVRQRIRSVTWLAAGVTTVSLAVFIAMAEPEGGHTNASSYAWASAVTACCGAAALLAMAARWRSSRGRAALYGAAAAVVWALVATFIKATTDTLAEFGLTGTFVRWPVYALVVGALAGVLLTQAALHAGPLSVSQPFLVIVDPIVSIALSIWIFDERFAPDPAKLAVGALAFVGLCAGAVALTRTAPQTMDPAEVEAPG